MQWTERRASTLKALKAQPWSRAAAPTPKGPKPSHARPERPHAGDPSCSGSVRLETPLMMPTDIGLVNRRNCCNCVLPRLLTKECHAHVPSVRRWVESTGVAGDDNTT